MREQDVRLLPTNRMESTENHEEIPVNIQSIGTKTKWRQGYSGKGVVVAILDTGCETNHPDLKERIVGGYNFTEEHNKDIAIYEDLNGHGTHVSGIIAGSINKTGIVGVAPKAGLLVIKVLNRYGTGSVDSLIEGIHYAIDWRGSNGEKVRVISLSLGLKKPNAKLQEAIIRAVNNDISVVAASGNDGDGSINTNEYRYPGAYKEVIEVGATTKDNKIASFSNTNEYVDLFAPGEGIYSSFLEKRYTSLSGTSMATPHVSGALALLIEEYEYMLGRRITEIEIYQILKEHTLTILIDKNQPIYLINLSRKQELKE